MWAQQPRLVFSVNSVDVLLEIRPTEKFNEFISNGVDNSTLIFNSVSTAVHNT